MTDSIRQCYKDAIADDSFNHQMLLASPSGNRRPGFFSDELARMLYALAYYGYVIGKFGPEYAARKYPSSN